MGSGKQILKVSFYVTLTVAVFAIIFVMFLINTGSSDAKIAEKEEIPTFTPFTKTADNEIVETKDYFLDKYRSKSSLQNADIVEIKSSDDFNRDIPYEVDEKAGVIYKRVYSGRRINVAVTGVDSRLGSRYKHADANHVLSILPDQGIVEIYSVPRDTYADVGLEDSTLNKLAVLRAKNGRTAYLTEMARITGLDRIHYWMEVGFSQAIGIIEWLGYKNSHNTLQVLRSRKVFDGGDWQRTYTQGQFIKQSLLKSYNNYSGVFGDVVLLGGLSLVDTNIDLADVKEILRQLRKNNFGKEDDVTVSVRPQFKFRYKKFDFDDAETIAYLQGQVDSDDSSKVDISELVAGKLTARIAKAREKQKYPWKVISLLDTYFDQKAWLQISDKQERHEIREELKTLLAGAYRKRNNNDKANEIEEVIDRESKMFIMNLNIDDPFMTQEEIK